MPLRDHFRQPQRAGNRWDAVHGAWPTLIAADVNTRLPERYIAAPRIYLGSAVEVDAAALERRRADHLAAEAGEGGVAVATAVGAPPRPTLSVATERPNLDEYEVLIRDLEGDDRIVAAIELVSPGNKDRPESRRAFAGKCGALLLRGVCVAIVDPLTIRTANLYGELIELLGAADPSLTEETPGLYAGSSRWLDGILDAWIYPLEIGQVLPTLPLWLDGENWVPLDLEATYEETLRILRMR